MEIKPTPDKPPALDPNEPRFWDTTDLEHELRRVFEICHGCRMCVTYCPSFPFLFDRIDENHEKFGQAHSAVTLNNADFRTVTDLCFQCKICYVKCPYTPEDPESNWMVDFPRLLLREKAVRSRQEGISLQERLLGEPGLLGALNAGPQAGMVNLVSTHALFRKVLDKAAGIATEFPLPTYATETFPRWFKKHTPLAEAHGEVAIFSTCLVDYNKPETGQHAVLVLESAGLRVVMPEQKCCGMPMTDTGDLDGLREQARFNVLSLVDHVRAGRPIVCPGPSCSMMLRKEYPELLDTPEARLVAANTYDLMDYLWKLWKESKLPRTFKNSLESVAYHAPCHLRAQKISLPARMLLEKIPETEVTVIEQCSAVDGTWGMKSQYYDLGVKYSRKLVRAVDNAEARWVASDCPLASQRIVKENRVPVVHPVSLLARAYGLTD